MRWDGWDLALDGGERCVDGLKNLVRVIAFPSHATSVCPVCDSVSVQRDHLLAHVITSHVAPRTNFCKNCHPFQTLTLSYLTTCVTLLILVLLYPTGSLEILLTFGSHAGTLVTDSDSTLFKLSLPAGSKSGTWLLTMVHVAPQLSNLCST